MSFFSIPNVKITGVSACVPKKTCDVGEGTTLTEVEIEKLRKTTGISSRRLVDANVCASDLCYYAAEKLIKELGWQKEQIDALVFVTQTPDYILPATSPILQQRLGLLQSCFTLDISLGCSGYVYGLTTLASLMSTGNIKKALLLVGDTVSRICSPKDKSTYPLFGDAGTATALEYHNGASPMLANMKSDGGGYEAIHIKDGGYRNIFSETSLKETLVEEGISRNNNQLVLNGMDVFSFGITKAPEVINELNAHFNIVNDDSDYFVFHQANLFMNEKIRKKLKLPEEKVPYSLAEFGNTSCATIPLTIVNNLKQEVRNRELGMVLCGFGVGLSWGAIKVHTDKLICPDLIEI